MLVELGVGVDVGVGVDEDVGVGVTGALAAAASTSEKTAPVPVNDESDVKKKVYDAEAGSVEAAGSAEPDQRADDQPAGVVT